MTGHGAHVICEVEREKKQQRGERNKIRYKAYTKVHGKLEQSVRTKRSVKIFGGGRGGGGNVR